MKKRIISFLCVVSMLFACCVQPVSANDSLYAEFAASTRAEARTLFISAYNEFDISKGGATYSDSEKSMIILEAWNKGFSSFAELNSNVTKAAEKLSSKLNDTSFSGDKWGHTTGIDKGATFDAPATTSEDDIFEVGGQEFIALDSVTVDGEDMLYVMVKSHDYFGNVVIDGNSKGEWSADKANSLPNRLTTQFAFGNLNSGAAASNLPSSVLEHIDVMHEWPVEPGSRSGYTNRHKHIAPVSAISVTEYKLYYSKIGYDGATNRYWTRTPVKGNAGQYFCINTAGNTAATNGHGGYKMRPVFYLKSSFFKEEKMEKCGANVTAFLDKMLTRDEIEDVYSDSEIKNVFGSLSVTPEEVIGDAIVGSTLTTDYSYSGNIALLGVEIVWEKSLDQETWVNANGDGSKSYKIKSEDAGYFIRAAFKPVFDSIILAKGETTYAVKADAVYTDAAVAEAVKEVDTASDIATLREKLQKHESLFHLDYSESAFSDDAAVIFRNDRVSSVEEVLNLYHSAIALDAFAKSTDADAKEKAESEYLLGSIPEYKKVTEEEQRNNIILNLFLLSDEKYCVSDFIEKAEEIIMLERFNNSERANIVSLIKEYAEALAVNISGLSQYQLEIAGTYVAGKNFGTDIDALEGALADGVKYAKTVKIPQSPSQKGEANEGYAGIIPPVTEKPEVSGDAPTEYFSDLQNVPWGVTAINTLAQKGVLSGAGNGTFAPDRLVTRNEFVKMIVVAFGIELNGNELSYADIDNNSWSAEYIKAAVDAGIITGISDTLFGDGMNIVRQDAAVIAQRVMEHKGITMKSSTLKFKDSQAIADYAVDAVAKMSYCGIMNGKDGNIFDPNGGTTRAQAAVIIYNLMNYYENQTKVDEDSETIVVTRTEADKYDILYNLGIMKDEFATDAKITRGEFAVALAVFGGYQSSVAEGLFDDVKTNHKYGKEIEAVYKNNIIAPVTEKLFMPDEPVTYKEAYDAIVAITGYKEFPNLQYRVDNAMKQEPVFAGSGTELTSDMLKKMLFAALEIPVFDFVSVDEISLSEKTILNVNFKTYKSRGIVNAVAGVSIGGRGEVEDDRIIITVDSKDYLYNIGNNDYSDYLGFDVIYYYTESNDAYSVVGLIPADSQKTQLRLSFEQIFDAESDLSSITYESGNRDKEAKISKTAEFIYNGRRCYSVTSDDLVPNNGYITLIDTDTDRVYDVVKIDTYEYIMVAQKDMSNNSVLDRFTWKTYGFEEGVDAEKINFTKNGRYIKMDFLSNGDVLAISKSRDGKLLSAYVSDSKVIGKIRKQSPKDRMIQVDDTTLETVKDFDFDGLTSNVNVTVGLDWNGYAVGYYTDVANTELRLGYVCRVVEEESAFGTKRMLILTENNEFVVLNTSKKMYINDEIVEQSSLAISPQLVSYSLDSEGGVKKIYTAVSKEITESTQKEPLVLSEYYEANAPGIVYNSFGMTIDFEYNMPKSSVLFDITFVDGIVDVDNSNVTTVGSQVIAQSSHPEKLYIYNADISKVSRLCVFEHSPKGGNDGYNESFNTQAFLITDIITKYDIDEGVSTTAYKGVHAGNEVEYEFTDKLKEEIDISKIQPGDVLLVWLSGKKINRFRRLFAKEEKNALGGDTDLLCNYGDHEYDGSSITRGSDNWDYPYDWAQHIIERAEGKSGSTAVAATRWASLYGTVEFAYKDDNYAYPVLRFRVAGMDETNAYTLDANTKIYMYDAKNLSVEILDNEKLNFSMKNAVLTTRYGNIRDVIIYE